jgi:hypothetical protein
MGGDDRAFKGVWICAAVSTNPDLSWIEKALIAEIDSLVRDEAPHFAGSYLIEFQRHSTRFNVFQHD